MPKKSTSPTRPRHVAKQKHSTVSSYLQTPHAQKGIGSLAEQLRAAKRDASRIYLMVTGERGTTEELRALTRYDSLFELICIALDQGKRAMHLINASRSRRVASAKKEEATARLRDWLENNLHRFQDRPWRTRCIQAIKKELPNLGRDESLLSKEIGRFRAERKSKKSRN